MRWLLLLLLSTAACRSFHVAPCPLGETEQAVEYFEPTSPPITVQCDRRNKHEACIEDCGHQKVRCRAQCSDDCRPPYAACIAWCDEQWGER